MNAGAGNGGLFAKVPADVDRPDRVLAGLTARQVAILGATALVVYGAWWAGGRGLPLVVFVILVAPVVVAGAALALGRRDGIDAADLSRAVLGYRLRPRRLHAHPPAAGPPPPAWASARARHTPDSGGRPGPLGLPGRDITDNPHTPASTGVLELGADGIAVIAAASTINFAMRTEVEQYALIGCFARLLHAQTGPMQILIRAHRAELRPVLAELAEHLGRLRDPTLRAAAAAHHHWLAELAADTTPLAHQVLLVLREPTPATASGASRDGAGGGWRAAAMTRLAQRLDDARH